MGKSYCQDCGQSFSTSMKYCSKCGASNINSNKLELKHSDRDNSTNTDIKSNFNNFNTPYQQSYAPYLENNSHHSIINIFSQTIASIVSWISIIPFILIPLSVFTIYPAYNENVSNNCSALETHVISIISHQNTPKHNDMNFSIFGGRLLTEISNGSMASAYIKELYPDVPPSIACTLEYWRVLLDNNHAQQLLSQLKP